MQTSGAFKMVNGFGGPSNGAEAVEEVARQLTGLKAELREKLTAFDGLRAEWERFKPENDRRIAEAAKNGGRPDPLTDEKINRHSVAVGELQASVTALQKQIENLEKEAQRIGPGAGMDAEEKARAKAESAHFSKFMRATGLHATATPRPMNTASAGSSPDGGWFVPDVLDSEIIEYEKDNAPMRELCRVRTVTSENFTQVVNNGGASSGWVGETESRGSTSTPTLSELTPSFGEIYAKPNITQKLLDDAAYDVVDWLASSVADEFSMQENDAFTNGTGVKKPKGILGYTLSTSVDGSRTLGQIQKVHSGTLGAFKFTTMIDLIHSLKRGYRQGAQWMLTTLAVAAIRKLKDDAGSYIFQTSGTEGEPSRILGYSYFENDDMPDPGNNTNAAIFGNFQRGYTIFDIRGVTVLRDPYTNKPYVEFYTTKRVGGHVTNDRCFKVYTLSA